MPALHRLNIPAVFLIIIICKHIFAVHNKPLRCPFVPPRQCYHLRTVLKGPQPLLVKGFAASAADGSPGIGHISTLARHINTDLLVVPICILTGNRAVIKESPFILSQIARKYGYSLLAAA